MHQKPRPQPTRHPKPPRKRTKPQPDNRQRPKVDLNAILYLISSLIALAAKLY